MRIGYNIDMDIRTKQYLEQDKIHYEREIRALYREFDRKFGLSGAALPIRFVYDEGMLGSYTAEGQGEKEHFTFSLYFLSFCNANPMHALDKQDLYAHEYAHYMQAHYEIPKEHLFKPGKHGSAWVYCCSLVGAAPSEYYRIGQGLKTHDYESALHNPWADQNYTLKDRKRQEDAYRAAQDSKVRYKVGDAVSHPKFGEGTIEEITPANGSVRLKICFADQTRVIDQKWLIKSGYKRAGDK